MATWLGRRSIGTWLCRGCDVSAVEAMGAVTGLCMGVVTSINMVGQEVYRNMAV